MNHAHLVEILSRDFLVPISDDGRFPTILMVERVVLPVFCVTDELPPLPAGCTRWEIMNGHALYAVLPDELDLFLQPPGELLPVAKLRERASLLLEAVRAGRANAEEGLDLLLDRLSEAPVYCPAGPAPGVITKDGLVPVFTSLATLVHVFGEHAWFGTIGADLLMTLPPDVGIELDPETQHSIQLPSDRLWDSLRTKRPSS